jgi:chromosome segregation ATPase
MTARREVPLPGDTMAWVHSELSEIKSRLALVQQAAEQSRAVSADAADTAHQLRAQIDTFDGHDIAISHLQDDMRAMRELLARAQEDVNSLRQSREEAERRIQAQSEAARQDKNDAGRRFGEIERQIELTQERFSPLDEYSRRNLEAIAQLAMRIEGAEAGRGEIVTMQSRAQTALSRIEQEIQRLTGAHAGLQREDDVQRERVGSALEALRRLESEVEALRQESNRISRLDDRLELVQAERTRHNERLIEVSAELNKIDSRLNALDEHSALIEARIAGYQAELARLRERILQDREQIAGYLHGLSDLASDLRKRHIVALEKEIRDIRGRALEFNDE